MTADGVHSYEMPTTPDDDWPTEDPVLAAFAEDLRIVASGPAPEPRPGLVAAMRQGPIVPMGPRHERKRMPVKTFLGSLVAKLALGVGIATASVTAAGAAGVLPDAAQHAVSTVVGATTPFSIPDGSTVHAADVPDLGSTTTTSSPSTTVASTSTTVATKGTDDGTDTESGDTGGTTGVHPDNHGACVSAAAHADTSSTGENHGKAVSAVAKSDCGKSTSTTIGSTTTSSTSSTIAGANPGSTTKSGPGNSNGNGNSANSHANTNASGKGSSSKGGPGTD